MGIETVDILGVPYLDRDYFLDNARIFKCKNAIAGWSNDELDALIASASRAADAYCLRSIGSFSGGLISETHSWRDNRRTTVNNPPISTVSSYTIRTGPNGNDGNSGFTQVFPVSNLLINRQENYVELASLVLATGLISQIISLGITTPQVEISYFSYTTVPQNVALATGYIAGYAANQSLAGDFLPSGLSSVKDGDMAVTRHGMAGLNESIPQQAKDLLQAETRWAIA